MSLGFYLTCTFVRSTANYLHVQKDTVCKEGLASYHHGVSGVYGKPLDAILVLQTDMNIYSQPALVHEKITSYHKNGLGAFALA